jgi:hypothetical protein
LDDYPTSKEWKEVFWVESPSHYKGEKEYMTGHGTEATKG